MIDTKTEIENRLFRLLGLDVSSVRRAADMLVMHFGPQKPHTNRRGTFLLGDWALHVQCDWLLQQNGKSIATQNDFRVSDEGASRSSERLDDLLVKHGPFIVENVSGNNKGGTVISLSRDTRFIITSTGEPDEEDWRFFKNGSDSRHFVIEGGRMR